METETEIDRSVMDSAAPGAVRHYRREKRTAVFGMEWEIREASTIDPDER